MELGFGPKSIVPGIHRLDVEALINQALRKRPLSGANVQYVSVLG
jgi:hypothetical protein